MNFGSLDYSFEDFVPALEEPEPELDSQSMQEVFDALREADTPSPLGLSMALRETVSYYGYNPATRRTPNGAFEITPEGKKGAVARFLLPECAARFQTNLEAPSTQNLTDADFKPQYHGIPNKFWGHLETLHNEDSYWAKEGLSAQGRQYVLNLIADYCPDAIHNFQDVTQQ
jgi:hypothetical protein